MTTFLLDANVLIALTAREHLPRTCDDLGRRRPAMCAVPVVEGALIRFAVRLGASATEAQHTMHLVRDRAGYEFWPDSLSCVDAELDQVRGHRQVTDAYLASLSGSGPAARLATMDEGLAQIHPELTRLVPTPTS